MGKNRGLSLLEVLLSVALLSFLAGVSLVGIEGSSRKKVGADVLAELVADQFRTARAQAMSQGVPTALVFPSSDGSVPHSQSCYLAQGETNPEPQKPIDFSGDFPNSCLFVGLVGATGETLNPPPSPARFQGFNPSGWLNSKDYQFIFLPSGALVTNNLPLVNGKYFVVVAGGVQYQAASPAPAARMISPAPKYFSLTGAFAPYTVSLTQEGVVNVETGTPGVGLDSPQAQGWTTNPAPTISRPTDGVSAPQITAVEIQPRPPWNSLPPGIDCLVRDGEYIAFTVRATDDSFGAPLCEMSASVNGAPVGGFSQDGKKTMAWDKSAQKWTSEWSWMPPKDRPVGTIFNITSKVTDRDGKVGTSPTNASPRVLKTQGGKFILGQDSRVLVINDDGSRARWVNVGTGARLSPDGEFFVYVKVDPATSLETVYMVDVEGRAEEVLFTLPPGESLGSWDFSYDRAGLLCMSGGSVVYRPFEGPAMTIGGDPATGAFLRCATQTNRFATVDGDGAIRVYEWDRNTESVGAPLLTYTLNGYSAWRDSMEISPDGSMVLAGGYGHSYSYVVDVASGQETQVLSNYWGAGAQTSQTLAFSPDGQRVAHVDGYGLHYEDIYGGNGGTIQHTDLGAPADPAFLTWRR